MENPEEKNEKQTETTEKKPKSVKIDGVSSQINLGQDTPAHRQWARILVTSGYSSPSACMKMLMDAFENPARNADDQATIANLELELEDLKSQNAAYDTTCKSYEAEIADLKQKLESATNTANENAARAQSIEMAHQGAIVIKPNPVVAYFLNEMASKTNKTPAEILQELYVDDLQNPRANNLPYTVPSSRIREVMEELKPKP